MIKITPAARARCTAHTLADQLAALREAERRRILAESCERILQDGDELRPRATLPNPRLAMQIDED